MRILFILGSPTIPPPPSSTNGNVIISSPGSEVFNISPSHIHPGLTNPSTLMQTPLSYVPPLPFGTPELLHKSPFLPYDFHALKHVRLNNINSTILPGDNYRLSPVSSRPSSSSPPTSQTTTITIKFNETDNPSSNHDVSSDDTDDENIDVVKSAFIPILRPNHNTTAVQSKVIEFADSTVQDKESKLSPSPPTSMLPTSHQHHHHHHQHEQQHQQNSTTQPRQRCELKAPSSKKLNHITTTLGPKSPDTKIKSATISSQKTVWRPY